MDWRIKLKRALRSRKITYEVIGNLCGVTVPAVGHWLAGRREPPLKALRIMAEQAGMTLNDLFNEDSRFLIVDLQEIAMIEALRKVPPERKALVPKLIESLHDLPPDGARGRVKVHR